MSARGLVATATAAAVISACGLVFDVDALGSGSSSIPDAAGAESAADGGGCEAPRGARMINADGVCIDTTKVTVADYNAFLGDATPLPREASCDWLRTWRPPTLAEQLQKGGDLPITDVNWCQAFGYCRWAGKRLCGRIGGGGANPVMPADPATTQWIFACTRGGMQNYPYGREVLVDACPLVPVVPVRERIACAGPYEGLFDMVGNASEWIDACQFMSGPSGTNKDACITANSERVRGSGSCLHTVDVSRDSSSPFLGFRCCL